MATKLRESGKDNWLGDKFDKLLTIVFWSSWSALCMLIAYSAISHIIQWG